jgi:hypothetical protein
MTSRTDQKIGNDAVARYTDLRKQVDEAMKALDQITQGGQ